MIILKHLKYLICIILVPSNAETGFLDGDLTVIGNICDNPELIK